MYKADTIDPLVPSSFVQNCSSIILQSLRRNVADIACGSGRNLVPFLSANPTIHAFDINLGALGSFKERYPDAELCTKEVDLCSPHFSLPSRAYSLVILSHFYTRDVFRKVIESVEPKGFLLFETIDDRGMNFLEMPLSGEVQGMLETNFEIKKIVSKEIRLTGRQKLKILAQRIL